MSNQGQFGPLPMGRIAVSQPEHELYGCPSCGYLLGYAPMTACGCAVWSCGNCGEGCIVLADGLTRSAIGIGSDSEGTVYPELQRHPRWGTPGHRNLTRQPGA